MKKVSQIAFILILAGALALLVFAPNLIKNTEEKRPKIVTTTFVAYDLTRSIIKDTYLDVEMLLAPGSDLHSYGPSPQDISKIKESLSSIILLSSFYRDNHSLSATGGFMQSAADLMKFSRISSTPQNSPLRHRKSFLHSCLPRLP